MFRSRHTSLLAALIVLIAGVFAVDQFCHYYVDPDATAYLTISQRYAAGDFDKAINGYWSPWSCWLTSLLIQTGISAISSAIIINTIGALGFLILTHSFFILFLNRKKLILILELTLALFLPYAIFKQSFADLWACFFLLLVLRIIISENFSSKSFLWILTGIIGTLAYFAKAYSFPFFILNIIVCSLLINPKNWWKISAFSITAMVVCSFPWIYLLHQKYGIWTTSTAGSLNLSWYLVGHPYFKEGIEALLPPPYSDSPYYWEDPYLINGIAPHFWDSPKLFLLQILKTGYNLLKLVFSMNELSAFFLPLCLLAVLILFSKKIRNIFPEKIFIVCISLFLFPLGFLLINFEARYIWYMLPLIMLLGGLCLEYFYTFFDHRFSKEFVLIVFAGSFLVYPAYDFRNLTDGKDEYADAKILSETKQIKGSFAANDRSRTDVQRSARLAYFSGNSYYTAPYFETDHKKLLQELRRYNIRYYFYYYTDADQDFQLKDEQGNPFPTVAATRYHKLKVFLVNP